MLVNNMFCYNHLCTVLDFDGIYVIYCKTLYFLVFFISRFCDITLIRGNLNSRCLMLSYVNTIHVYSNISRECSIRETSISRILEKISSRE